MEIAGYIASLLIGVSLGLIGGGGSILTIPVLVYLFRIQPTVATGYSLFIVGCSSLAGAYKNYQKGNVHFKSAFYFGSGSIITVILIRKFLMPYIPETLFSIGSFVVTKSLIIMLLFAVVMMAASLNMIHKQVIIDDKKDHTIHLTRSIIRGIQVGILTGLLGAGGGFIIIPVLIFSFHLSMKQAIGTSLLIMSMNSLLGFIGDLFYQHIDWPLLLTVTAISIAGTFLGRKMGETIPGEKLKKGFGWFILIMGIYIILHELFRK